MVEDVKDLATPGKFANIDDPVWSHLLNTMRMPVNLDDLYAIPAEVLLDGLKAFKYQASNESPTIMLTLAQVGR